MGFCQGIETLEAPVQPQRRRAAAHVARLFSQDFLLVIDESHQTVPQVGADVTAATGLARDARRIRLPLPSALDNRPLKFEEFEKYERQCLRSATPGDYELEQTKGVVIEQVIRPTGLMDPECSSARSRPVDDLLTEIRKRVEKEERVLVTTLTKRMAEDLTDYYRELGVQSVPALDVETLDRIRHPADLRRGEFDVLVGINLLREGSTSPRCPRRDPRCRQGRLSPERVAIQTCGRARATRWQVFMYADKVTVR